MSEENVIKSSNSVYVNDTVAFERITFYHFYFYLYVCMCVCVYFLFYQLTGSFCFVSKQRAYTTSTSASALVPAMQAGVILLTEIRPLFHRPWITPATSGRNTERWVRLCFVFFFYPYTIAALLCRRRR